MNGSREQTNARRNARNAAAGNGMTQADHNGGREELTQARLKEVLQYDPETGYLLWRISKQKVVKGKRAGSVRKDGYINIRIEGGQYLAHKLVWLYFKGYLPKMIDHIDRDRANNRIDNLREATVSDNMHNSGAHSDSQIPYKGVNKHFNMFRAKIRVNGVQKHLGLFTTAYEAAKAYDEAARKYHGEFRCLNIEE